MTGKLAGRVALVTGGSSGIGATTARLLAAEGAAVVVADVTGESGRETAASIEARGGRAVFHRTDVADPAQVATMVKRVIDEYGALHILFANAGVGGFEVPMTEWADEMWREVIDINLTGVFYCCREAVPAIRASGGGAIVLTSSVAGSHAMPLNCAYNAAKAGVIMLAHTLVPEVGPEIRVNVVAPGVIRTPMTEFYDVPFDQYAQEIPLGRVGTADDVARAVLYLASDEAAYLSGSVLTVDGGIKAVLTALSSESKQ